MHRLRLPAYMLAVLPVFFSMSPPASGAQETTAPKATEDLPPARAIIDRFIEVTGSDKLVARTKSQHVTGTITISAFGLEGSLEIWKAKPNKYKQRIDLGAMGGLIMSGNNGKVGWSSHPMLGDRILEGAELLDVRNEALYGAELKPADRYESIETVGKEQFDGVECYKLEFVAKPLEGMDAAASLKARTSYTYYEVETGLARGEEKTSDGPTGQTTAVSITTDYKDFDGARISMKTLTKTQGMEILLAVDSVTFDGVEDSAFDLPPGIASLAKE